MDGSDQPTLEKVNQELLDLEHDLELFDRRVDGVQYWELVRHSLHKKIVAQTQNFTDSSSNTAQPKWRRLFDSYTNALSELVHNVFNNNPFITKPADVVFYGGRRRQMEDGSWYNPHTDPIADHIDCSHIFIEKDFIRRHGGSQKEAPENLRYLMLPNRLGDLIKQFGYTYDLPSDEITVLRAFESAIKDNLNVEIDVVSEVELELSNRQIRLPLYKKIINRINPNICIVCMWPHTIIEACNELNIDVINIQSSSWDQYYWKYYYPNNRKPQIKPDELWIWGEYWKNATSLPFDKENIRIMGFPHYEKKLEQYSGVSRKNQVLFISNPKSGPQLSELATELATTDIEMNIVYKLHSMEFDTWKKSYPQLAKMANADEISVVDEAEGSLHKLFAESKAQVGVSSTAIYEGLGFGLPTYILSAPWAIEMQNLIHQGYVEQFSGVNELVSKLNDNEDSIDFNQGMMFAKDSNQKIKSYLSNYNVL